MKLVVLTSNSLRHKYIVSKLVDIFDVQLIISEEKSVEIEDTKKYNLADVNLVNEHFDKRNKSENKFFGDFKKFPSETCHLNIPHKEINSSFIFNVLNVINPDVIVLFGTSIIKKHILNKYQDRVINLHLGLSPYYKGSATNLFPFYYKQIECIGATIHIATENVDAGDIIHQYRPDINLNDDIHDIGNKVILKSGIELPKAIKSFFDENFVPVKQIPFESVICKIKEVTPDLLRVIYSNIETGIVETFLRNEESLINEKPIIKI